VERAEGDAVRYNKAAARARNETGDDVAVHLISMLITLVLKNKKKETKLLQLPRETVGSFETPWNLFQFSKAP
jgi:hypothetical protein